MSEERIELQRARDRLECLRLEVTSLHDRIRIAKERLAGKTQPKAAPEVSVVLDAVTVTDIRTGTRVALNPGDFVIPPEYSYAKAADFAAGRRVAVVDATRIEELERLGALQ